MRAKLDFGSANTGLLLADLTVDLLWLLSAPATDQRGALDVGAVLEEVGRGIYYYNAPLVTAVGGVQAHKTADATIWARGEFSVADEATAPAAVISGLCTLADIKTILKAEGSSLDSVLTQKIAEAESYFQNETGYTLVSASHTEYFSPGRRGGGVSSAMSRLRVKEHPIISVTSIYEDADRTWDDADDLIPAADYTFDDYGIELLEDKGTIQFQSGQKTVRVVYVAGFATIPAFLRRGVAHYAASLYYQEDPARMRSMLASESLGDATVTYLNEEAPKIVAAAIRQYRRPLGL